MNDKKNINNFLDGINFIETAETNSNHEWCYYKGLDSIRDFFNNSHIVNLERNIFIFAMFLCVKTGELNKLRKFIEKAIVFSDLTLKINEEDKEELKKFLKKTYNVNKISKEMKLKVGKLLIGPNPRYFINKSYLKREDFKQGLIYNENFKDEF